LSAINNNSLEERVRELERFKLFLADYVVDINVVDEKQGQQQSQQQNRQENQQEKEN
jgi:hypothetical protein